MGKIVELQMTVELDDNDHFAQLAERWLGDSLSHLLVECWDWPLRQWSGPVGIAAIDALGLVSTETGLYETRVVDGDDVTRSFSWGGGSLPALVRGVSEGANAKIWFLQPKLGSFPVNVNIRVARSGWVPNWAYFTVTFDEEVMADVDMANRLLHFFKGFADLADASFGHISRMFSVRRTALENLLGKSPEHWIAQSRQFLRGYSWLTVCSQEVGDLLGGVDRLLATGAFFDVQPLASGGLWLQATPTYQEYDMPAAERVFRAVAAALPAGLPIDPSARRDGYRYLVVIEDPAESR